MVEPVKTRVAPRIFLSGALCTLLFGKLSLAQTVDSASSRFSLEVERSRSALRCPDLTWFLARVASHPGRSGQAGKFKVTLERRGGTWRARIQSWEPGNESLPPAERVLQDRSTACEPLAEAVSVTIAILAEDVAAKQAPLVTPEEPAAPAAPEPPPRSEPPPAEPAEPDFRVWIGAGGGAAAAWISPLTPLFGASVAFDSKRFRQAVRVMLTTPQNFDLYPGRIVVQAWLASMLSCLRLTGGDTGAALCATFDAGMLNGRAEGFAESKPSTQSYEAVGLELLTSVKIADRLRLSSAFAGLVPFTRESFSVTGLGVAYVPPSLNGRVLIFLEMGTF